MSPVQVGYDLSALMGYMRLDIMSFMSAKNGKHNDIAIPAELRPLWIVVDLDRIPKISKHSTYRQVLMKTMDT